jgi:hypothetical protein
VVNALTGIADPLVADPLLQNLTHNGVLDLLRPAFVSAIQQFLADGILDPCSNSSTTSQLVDLEMDQLCAALVENDLSSLLEQGEQPFPIEFCQSPNDEIVAASNLPTTLATTDKFTQVEGVTGDHYSAGQTCFLHLVSSAILASTTTLVNYSIPALHDPQACHATSLSSGKETSPTMAPPNSNGDTSSSATWSMGFLNPTSILVMAAWFLHYQW